MRRWRHRIGSGDWLFSFLEAWESDRDQLRQGYLDTTDVIDDLGVAAGVDSGRRRRGYRFSPSIRRQSSFRTLPDAVALRGVGQAGLPEPAKLAALSHPTLILAWDTDPLHSVSTAERLAQLIPHSTLHIARNVDDVKTWTQRTADFFRG